MPDSVPVAVPHVGTNGPGVPVLLDVATALALGGAYAANAALVRVLPKVFGVVASDPTVWKLIGALTEP